MNKNINIKQIEYLSLILVLSFFIYHNIYIVLIGVSLAVYTINKDLFDNIIKKNINVRNDDKFNIYSQKQPEPKESYQEDSLTSLVESIEKLGFIPSLKKDEHDNAA